MEVLSMDGNLFKPFTTSLIGSLPRSKELLMLKESSMKSEKYNNVYLEKYIEETNKVISFQKDCGIEVIVSGELDRDNYMSYIGEIVDGVKLLTLEELKELTGNNENFRKSLEEMDASDNSMNSPICFKKINTEVRLNKLEIEVLKDSSVEYYKCTLPSPYLLTRSMWLKEITGNYYESRNELGEDVVKLLRHEIRELVKEGVKIIQIDEPILSEVVFTNSKSDNSFY
jgi:5-methyltetrahydropteroyltriglutamate--homocysteine S-methyltransferase